METRILLATPATVRLDPKTGKVWDSIDIWMRMAKAVEGVHGIYLHLNDIPADRRWELTNLADAYGIDWDYADYGFPPDDRSLNARAVPGKEYERFVVTRNWTHEYAVASGFTHLLMVDSDVLVRPETVAQLMPRMAPGVGMCALLMNARTWLPPAKYLYNIGYLNETKDGFYHVPLDKIVRDNLMPVYVTGAAAMLDLSAVEDIQYECHKFGEDYDICDKMIKRGWKVLCDTSVAFESFHIQQPRLIDRAENYLKGGAIDYA